MEKDPEVARWRDKIDRVDAKLIGLFNSRAEYALEIGRIKRKAGLPVYCPEREDQIYRHVQETNPGPLSDSAIKRLFERIIDETRRLEREECERKK